MPWLRRRKPPPEPEAEPHVCESGHDLDDPNHVYKDRAGKEHCRVCWALNGPELPTSRAAGK